MRHRSILAAMLLLVAAVVPASAQDAQVYPDGAAAQSCLDYQSVLAQGSAQLSDQQLVRPDAPGCLMQTLTTLSHERKGDTLSPDMEADLTRVTGLLGKIVDLKGPSAIEQLRQSDSIDVIDLLAYGASSPEQDTRINSTLLLSNIVDNSTVCVVMDHLADPALAATESGAKARRNLLASVSVVAPWAMKSNYQNMQALGDYLARDATVADSTKTSELLGNFKARLAYQTKIIGANMNSDTPEQLKGCQSYRPKWAVGDGFTLKYPSR